MLTEWRLGNFKSVSDSMRIPLAPLTVLAGANSSGKSTLVHSMLLIAQTLQSKMAGQPLVLNGDYIKLGTPEDVTHAGTEESLLEIGFTIEPIAVSPRDIRIRRRRLLSRYVLFAREHEGRVAMDAHFEPAQTEGRTAGWTLMKTVLNVHIEEDEASPKLATAVATRAPSTSASKLEGVPDLESIREPFREALQYDLDVNQEAKRSWRFYGYGRPFGEIVGAILEHFLPYAVAEKHSPSRARLEADCERATALLSESGRPPRLSIEASEETLERARTIFKREFADVEEFWRQVWGLARGEKIPEDQLEEFKNKLHDILDRAEQKEPTDYQIEGHGLPDVLQYGTSAVLSEFTENLRYLGPLRDYPKPIYSVSPLADPTDIGLKGEYVAAVLENFKTRQVEFVNPREDTMEKGRLTEAACVWLEHMGMLEEVSTRARGKLGLELSVRQVDVDKELDLTNVGVGVSQVLPILVMGLLADKGQVLIFEQPEIHLHPKVQSILGDFFLSLMRCGKQCIIETHSEYLVKRLRLRVAEDVDGSVLDNLAVYFVEKTQGVSQYRPVDIAENGKIREWPKGFFDEGAKTSQQIIQASLLVDKKTTRSERE
ncbi:MAG: DUF3696 domain-containing protein [Planctomycetota bacterium]